MAEDNLSERILVEVTDGVLVIRMNRPDKKNALTRAMYQAMADALLRGEADDSVRVMMITGTADCFTSGNDLADFMAAVPESGHRPPNPFLPVISQCEKPIVAAVNGFAVGIGSTMLLHCDLVCAGNSARFQLPFVNLGLCPELASSLLLPRVAGYQRAAELLLLGETFSAETARQAGIVNRVCADDQVLPTGMELARKIAAQPPAAVRLTKALLRRETGPAVQQRIADENANFSERLASPEAAEAFRAFAERRKPDFSSFS